jgi:amidohydrolase
MDMMVPISFDQIAAHSRELFPELQTVRRYLHAHPETGRQEYNTSAYLRQRLQEKFDFNFAMVGSTGFCCDLVLDQSKPWLSLRADLDALPIADQKEVLYRSTVPNVCHACGHDFHSTVVLGTAWTLGHFQNHLNTNIRFIFQHAEEPIPGGAIDFVQAGKLHGIRAIFGLHADPSLNTGTIGLLPGWITAQSIQFKIELGGPGGHSARPADTVDPGFIGVSILNELYSSIYRLETIDQPLVFTIGRIGCGESYNLIPSRFTAEGTLRVTHNEQAEKLLALIDATVKNACTKWKAQGTFTFTKGAPPVINDAVVTDRVRSILAGIMDSKKIIPRSRTLGGEDFAHYLSEVPGVFLRIGINNGSMQGKLHSGYFDVDEQAIPLAVSAFSWILLKYPVELDQGF